MDFNTIFNRITDPLFLTALGGLITTLGALRINIPGFTKQCQPKDGE